MILPHDGDSGGVRRMRRIAAGLQERGYLVTSLVLRSERDLVTQWEEIPLLCQHLDRLICPGDLPLWQLVPFIPPQCSLYTFHLHLGMHDWNTENRNIFCRRIHKATTARWIQTRIRQMGSRCEWFGVAPFDGDIYEVPADRGLRIGTLAHAWYGWKNTRAVIDALPAIQEQCPGMELLAYGQNSYDLPGRFVLKPDACCRRTIYSQCRVWIVPSISEGIGMCGLEAMLCRTPVVSADNRGIREYADEDTCLLFQLAKPEDMVRHVLHLLHDWDAGRRMAECAYARVSTLKFDDCLDLIEGILGGGESG